MKKIGLILLLLIGCASLKTLFDFQPDQTRTESIWIEVKKDFNLNPELSLPKIIYFETKNKDYAGLYFPNDHHIEIHGFYGDSRFYRTIFHEILHFVLDLKGIPLKKHHFIMNQCINGKNNTNKEIIECIKSILKYEITP